MFHPLTDTTCVVGTSIRQRLSHNNIICVPTLPVFNGERLRAQMAQAGISQAELARRVGVSQQAIARLASGNSQGSRHIHRIAREIGTTPAYLSCETDDPSSEGPEQRSLSSESRELLDCFDALEQDERRSLLRVAQSMSGRKVSGKPVTLPSTAALEDALSGFFQASPGLVGDELVHELAKSFPIILRAASDEIEEAQSDQNDNQPSHRSVPDAGHRAAQPRRRS